MSMENNERLYSAFSKALAIDRMKVSDELAYNSIPEWDSVAHMALVAEIELVFDIMLDTDDIIDMSSVGKAKTILAKYDVTI
jgi:acyl carrier protein